ncbi:MAG TPA: DEAD/DEAH box helicase family protein, partial [Leptospiraceae bacterium]|nr:DEAD/DEAH box helicase family protein [Leptospiraceae bacterium]
TGSGKTRTTMNYIADYLRKNEGALVIWLAYSEELCEQAVSEFKKAWGYLGNRNINIQRYYSNIQWQDGISEGLVVAGLSKLYNTIRNGSIQFVNDLSDKISLIVMDEAHQAIAESYNTILQILSRKENVSIIGLTATPGRSYLNIDEDEKLANFFHRNKITLSIEGYSNPIDYLTDNGYLAKVTFEPLTHKGGYTITQEDIAKIERELDLNEEILIRLGQDELRNTAILSRLKSLILYHKRIIFFAASVSHSALIAFMLRAIGIESYSVTGATPDSERYKAIQEYKSDKEASIVLCNYGVFTTGFDAPKTSCAMIARPTKSLVLYSQMVGRAIRGSKAGGNDNALIVTVVDTKLPGFRSMAEAFMNWEDVF